MTVIGTLAVIGQGVETGVQEGLGRAVVVAAEAAV